MQYQVQYAGVWRRAVALILDVIIIGSLTEPIWFNSGLFTLTTRATASGQVVPGVIQVYANPWTGLMLAVIPFAYFTLLEGFFGATAGKMLLGLKVVQLDGSPITWREAIVRNLLRAIDGLVFYLVGAIAIWVSPVKQRLGDRAADTVVVRRMPVSVQERVPMPGMQPAAGPQPSTGPMPSQTSLPSQN